MCKQGTWGHEAFVLVDGEAIVTVDDVEVGRLGPGAFFGEMAVVERDMRSATVTAATPMELLVLSAHEFDELLATAPTVTRRMLTELSRRLRTTTRRAATPS